jgi:hypothetical protein
MCRGTILRWRKFGPAYEARHFRDRSSTCRVLTFCPALWPTALKLLFVSSIAILLQNNCAQGRK